MSKSRLRHYLFWCFSIIFRHDCIVNNETFLDAFGQKKNWLTRIYAQKDVLSRSLPNDDFTDVQNLELSCDVTLR
jgi:hypothetical protein